MRTLVRKNQLTNGEGNLIRLQIYGNAIGIFVNLYADYFGRAQRALDEQLQVFREVDNIDVFIVVGCLVVILGILRLIVVDTVKRRLLVVFRIVLSVVSPNDVTVKPPDVKSNITLTHGRHEFIGNLDLNI